MAPPPPPAPAPAPAAPAQPADLGGGELGAYTSRRFDLKLPLPDGRGWRVKDGPAPWLVATHAASSTALLVRTWRDDGRANRGSCEARARLWRDLPRREDAASIERRALDVPAGFDTVVEIGVSDPPRRASGQPAGAGNAPIAGFAVAFGGWARRCFAFVATTQATGPGAARLVAARLAAVVEVSLAGLTLESELAPAVPREGVP